jgi:hypothetical protein
MLSLIFTIANFDFVAVVTRDNRNINVFVFKSVRATVYCYSISSGLTGCGIGMMDFLSVSLDKAFLISAEKDKE